MLARGWQRSDRLPCADARPHIFYEIEGEASVVEAFSLADGKALAAHLPVPDPVQPCREIPRPHFIQEIE